MDNSKVSLQQVGICSLSKMKRKAEMKTRYDFCIVEREKAGCADYIVADVKVLLIHYI